MSTPAKINMALPEAKREKLKKLTRPGRVAWPTVWLAVTNIVIALAVYALAISDALPLWLASVVLTVNSYCAFSVVHDSIHRAISTDRRLNDWLGQATVLALSPMVSLGLFRWGHIQHHRYAMDERDPDFVLHGGPAWTLPLRWAFIDVWYFWYVVRSKDPVAYRNLRLTLVMTVTTLLAFAVLIVAGYGMYVLALWFIPSRLAVIMLGFSFFWLPHAPHDVSQADNFTRATTVREGLEWLMTPLLQYQNYHLSHHLYPSTPFYNNGKVWALLKDELDDYDLAIQHDWAINPEVRAAQPGAAAV